MGKSTKIISLSVKPDMDAFLKRVAMERGHCNKSLLARNLVEDFLPLDTVTYSLLKDTAAKKGVLVADIIEYLASRFPLDDDTVKPIVLKIPLDIAQNKESLHNWLTQKVTAIVNHLHP